MIPRRQVQPAAVLVLILMQLFLLVPSSGAAAKHLDFGTVGSRPSAHASPDPRAAHDGASSVATSGTILNLPVCIAPQDQTNAYVIPDGQGGAAAVWQDMRAGNWDIYAQRLGTSVDVLWGIDGVPVCKADGAQTSPQAVSDGAGGVIVVWVDERPTGDRLDIFAQRMNADGAAQWVGNGVPVCGAIEDQTTPVIVPDGVGGAIVAWLDARNGAFDIYAQRINASGVAQWAVNGVPLCTASGPRLGLTMVSDGQQGAIVAWDDRRTDSGDIYAQRVNGNGVALWTADGVGLSAATGTQEGLATVSDGVGGAIVAWVDLRGANRDVYAQHVDNAGAGMWTSDGVALCTAAGDQTAPAICGDGAGGALVAWTDKRTPANGGDIYAQRVSNAGSPVWTANGVAMCTAATDQVAPSIAADPMGGAVLAWTDSRTPANAADIYAQHVGAAAGAVQWTANGVQVCDPVETQDAAQVVTDGVGGALVFWRDRRAGTGYYDIYAQSVASDGQVANACVTQTLMVPQTLYTTTGAESYYEIPVIDLNWNAVGVRSSAPSDWDLEWYDSDTFGHDPAPICFSSQIGGSYTANQVDLLVGDFNPTHTTALQSGDPGFGLRATRYSGTGKDSVQWDNGASEVVKETTGSTCGAKQATTPWKSVVDVWEIVLFANKTYKFDFSATGGAIKMLFFSDAGQTGTYIVPRSAAQFEMGPSIYYQQIDITEVYGVLFVNDSNQPGTYCLKVTTQVGASDVGGGGPVLATGLRAVSPNPSPGRVRFEFALREPGSVGFDVVDMAGRLVSRIPARHWEAGIWNTGWDGVKSQGGEIPAGVYFVQMRVDGQRVGLSRLAIIH